MRGGSFLEIGIEYMVYGVVLVTVAMPLALHLPRYH